MWDDPAVRGGAAVFIALLLALLVLGYDAAIAAAHQAP